MRKTFRTRYAAEKAREEVSYPGAKIKVHKIGRLYADGWSVAAHPEDGLWLWLHTDGRFMSAQ